MEKVLGGLLVLVFGLVISVLWAFVLSFGVELLWNALLPKLFHLPTINYLQALGLMVLSSLLLKSSTSCHSK